MKETNQIDNSLGKVFPTSALFIGYIFFVFGIIYTFGNLIAGICFIIFGAIIGFTKKGIQIQIAQQLFRNYYSFIGFKFGKWNDLKKYKHITVLKTNQSHTAYSRAQIASTHKQKFIDIYLLTQSHRQKLLLKRLKDRNQAKKEALGFANKLNVELVNFNPTISQTSKVKKSR